MERRRAALNLLPLRLRAALVAVPVAVLVVFYFVPVANLIAAVFSADTVGDTLGRPALRGIVWYTLWQAVVSTLVTVAVAAVPAYLLHRFRFPGRRLVLAATLVPFFLPTVVVGAAFLSLLPESVHASPTAVIAAHVYLNLAVVVYVVGSMWEVLPTDLTGAARTLGASPWRVLREVVLPIIRPALLSAATLVFLFSLTSFGAAKILGGARYATLEVEIVRRATGLGDVDGAALLSLLQLAFLAIVIAVSSTVQRRAALHLHGEARPRRVPLRSPVTIAALGFGAVVVTPLASLIGRSLRLGGRWSASGWTQLGRTEVRRGISLGVDPLGALRTSLWFAVLAAAGAAVLAAITTLAIVALRRWGWLLDAGVALPLGTSAVTVGLGMLITFDTAPFDWRASWWLIPLGHVLVATPFAVRSMLAAARAIPDDLRAAAATLGASPARAWWHVDVRALRRPVVLAAGLAATVSLGEFGATSVLSRRGNQTVPLAIDALLGRTGDLPQTQAYVLATVLMAVCATIVVMVDAIRPATTRPGTRLG